MAKIIIKPAGKKGKGVFAKKSMHKGDVILNWRLRKNMDEYSTEGLKSLPVSKQSHADYIGRGKYILHSSPLSYINHSCAPNASIKYGSFREKSLMAQRAIYRGEEITVDYSIDAVDSWIMKCLCGNSNCRRTIYGDFRKLPEKLQDTYWLLVPRWKKRLLVRR